MLLQLALLASATPLRSAAAQSFVAFRSRSSQKQFFHVGKLTHLVDNDRSDLRVSTFFGVVVEFVRCLAGL